MKKQKGRLIAWLLFCLVLLLAGLGWNIPLSGKTGLQRQSIRSDEYERKEGEGTENEKVLTVWTFSTNENNLNILPGVLEMERRTGIKVNYVIVDGKNISTEFSLLLAKGEMPDIVYLSLTDGYPGGIEQAIEDGVFVDPTNLILNYMPNYRKMIEDYPEINQGVRTNSGRILLYSISGNDNQPKAEEEYIGLAVRADWLQKLEMDMPVTLQDWDVALTAFKEEMGAEAPLLMKSNGTLICGGFLSAFGVLPRFYVENGEVKYGPAEEGYREYLELMADWYRRGLIDVNFEINGIGWAAPDELLSNNVTGAAEIGWTQSENYFGDDICFKAVQNPVRNVGEIAYSDKIKDGIVNSLIGISSSCEDTRLAASWLDYQYSREGMELNFYGIEGESYEVLADGSYQLTEKILKDPDGADKALQRYARGNGLGWYNWQVAEKLDSQRQIMSQSRKVWSSNDLSRSYPYLLDAEGSADLEHYRITSALDALVTEKTVNYIMGREGFETYSSFQSLLEQYGLKKVLQYRQKVYDQYQIRGTKQ